MHVLKGMRLDLVRVEDFLDALEMDEGLLALWGEGGRRHVDVGGRWWVIGAREVRRCIGCGRDLGWYLAPSTCHLAPIS